MTFPRSTLLVGILGVGSILRATECQRTVKVGKIDGFGLAANPPAGPVRACRKTAQ
jgi:hypothetical protein